LQWFQWELQWSTHQWLHQWHQWSHQWPQWDTQVLLQSSTHQDIWHQTPSSTSTVIIIITTATTVGKSASPCSVATTCRVDITSHLKRDRYTGTRPFNQSILYLI
ncbi:hypothetical protein SAMD00019534_005190, partial [Acytostelium subglobosum LB1]|uniref:hypothetical protein n=1 Tax=Acytostelium subglobosum LB1 TaxID=1410327 RepID=UPI00064482A9